MAAFQSNPQFDLRVLALIPAYNEAERLGAVVEKSARYLPVLVVDDGSDDETAATAKAAGATVLRYTPNQGKGVALRTGFQWALAADYEAVLTLDADGQHDPAEIPKFLQSYAVQIADLIIGARSFREMPLTRRIANSVGCWLLSWALGHQVRDNQSGYRLISRQLLEKLLDSSEHGFEFEVEMLVTCLVAKLRLAWVPVRTIYAGESSHIVPWPHVRNFLWMVWQTRRRVKEEMVA
ncbi:MAG: glycosyltransferase family 2 protein [Chloroflexota bacterium]|nr:glycosyltransferase family 2 protein [Chloroflexota bacterium]